MIVGRGDRPGRGTEHAVSGGYAVVVDYLAHGFRACDRCEAGPARRGGR